MFGVGTVSVKGVGQVPDDDALLGNGTSAPDGELALDGAQDAELTQEQSEKTKEAEESFKVASVDLLLEACHFILPAKSLSSAATLCSGFSMAADTGSTCACSGFAAACVSKSLNLVACSRSCMHCLGRSACW